MARGFTSTPNGYTAVFTAEETSLLTRLFEDVATALEPGEDQAPTDPLATLVGITEDPQVPQDPALARILPVASEDPEVAEEFRRYTELNLRQQKIGHLNLAALDLRSQKVELSDEHANAWASALNDVRLTLGARLGIRDDKMAEDIAQTRDAAKVETVEDYMSLVYNFVTWLQDTLMEAMLSDLEDRN